MHISLAWMLLGVLAHRSRARTPVDLQNPPALQEHPDRLPFAYTNFGTSRRLVVHNTTLPPEATLIAANLFSSEPGEKVRKKRSDGPTVGIHNSLGQFIFVEPQTRVDFIPEYEITDPDPVRKRLISSVILMPDPEGMQVLVSSANCPNPYPNEEHQTFLLRVAEGYRMTFEILDDVDIERDFDFLFIHDGTSTSSPLLAMITGNSSDNPVLHFETTGRALFLLFLSDATIAGTGFKGFATPIPSGIPSLPITRLPSLAMPEICFKSILPSDGSIRSSSMINQASECYWLIEAADGRALSLTFSVLVLPAKSWLDVTDVGFGNILIRRLTAASEEGVVVTSVSNELLVHFYRGSVDASYEFAIGIQEV